MYGNNREAKLCRSWQLPSSCANYSCNCCAGEMPAERVVARVRARRTRERGGESEGGAKKMRARSLRVKSAKNRYILFIQTPKPAILHNTYTSSTIKQRKHARAYPSSCGPSPRIRS